MSTPAESARRGGFPARLAPAAVAFLLVAFGAPLVELAHGVSPWPGADVARRAGVLDGGAFRAAERRLADESFLAASVRPPYQELLFATLGVVTPKIVAGAEGWLFLRETSLDYPGADGERKVREHAALIGELAAWWRRRGVVLLAVPVPNKETLYPDRLPARASVRPMLPELLAALANAQVDYVDLRPALDPAAGLSFLPNDSHWSHEGARRSAEAVAAALRARFPAGVPGAPLAAEFVVAPDAPHRGDLQRMLGFRPESALDERFTVRAPRVTARATNGRALLDPAASLVVCGTSFSHSFRFSELVAAATGRAVADETVAGKGPTIKLLNLAERVRRGEIPPPAAIVWEFPEKHLFTRPFEFLEPLRAFAASAEFDAPADAAAPLAIAAREARHVAPDPGTSPVVSGRGLTPPGAARPDPFLVYTLAEPIVADGSAALELVIRTARPSSLKVFLDYGAGRFEESLARTFRTDGDDRPTRVAVPLQAPAAGARLSRFRVDPTNDDGAFTLEPPRLLRRRA